MEYQGDTYSSSCMFTGTVRATHTVARVCLQGISGRNIQGLVFVYGDCQEVVSVLSRRSWK